MTIQHLFVYGTLAPNRPNAHVLAPLAGEWQAASIKGQLKQMGWGAELGFPGLTLQGDEVIDGFVLSSHQLDDYWQKLDEFEGQGYRRVLTNVKLTNGHDVTAFVYVLNDE